ncbi:hypothetical protein GIB67_005130 [Kingdonia uniflora]|uniref:Protein kinase domain-containing protein n=1 Tax=Kingdonia uniflora TaxID=39325 RepID=A0A7J7LA57_9MAGN|nr:hypothetical protein GIB67_005130 [Kingdonia uniflora]
MERDPTPSSSSSSDFLRHVQAAFKRQRPIGTSQLNSIRPRRVFVPPQKELGDEGSKRLGQVVELIDQRIPDDSSITPPAVTGTLTMMTRDEIKPPRDEINGQKKVQFYLGENPEIHQRGDGRMAIARMDNLSSHMGSLALTEMEWDANAGNGGGEMLVVNNEHDMKQRDQVETSDVVMRSDGGISSLLAKRSMLTQDHQHQFPTFMSQSSSVVGPSCATMTSVHSRSAPMMSSTTYSSRSQLDSSSQMEIEQLDKNNVNPRPISLGDSVQSRSLAHLSSYDQELPFGDRDHGNMQQGLEAKGSNHLRERLVDHTKDKSNKVQDFDITNVQTQAPVTKDSISSGKLNPSKSNKPEKSVNSKGASAPRKKNHDPDLFFKVNGKLYQKLGKIGSGGSSEVFKVITADCTIFALKKIKLKGRDFSTAFGFCQEIEYLNKLKGKNNIIQLIDYEVTDKTLLAEVTKGSMTIKDGRIRDDEYIYMVLEYGEIDLAHMLSLKWKEMDTFNLDMDENWLRFYWQQILQAVNTIHEERIVHSDLKPANFLLVRGSLKLIDFGIAKAIMSDTTNIQRDSQVGTLSYMSPEAFMCNENDADGNTIKCGRPSDIWSLGCILYQMVYSRTPFSEYKTFWAKFKVITDRNHDITYGPISNPLLLDLMKKCLAWDRNERWRIPQLLQHPFLVPPVPSQLFLPQDQGCKLFQQIAKAYGYDHQSSILCSEIQQLLTDPRDREITDKFSKVRDQHCGLLSHVSRLCSQLQQHLAKLENDVYDTSL